MIVLDRIDGPLISIFRTFLFFLTPIRSKRLVCGGNVYAHILQSVCLRFTNTGLIKLSSSRTFFFFLNAKYQIRISNDLPYFNKQWSVPELLEHYNSVGI